MKIGRTIFGRWRGFAEHREVLTGYRKRYVELIIYVYKIYI